MGPESWGLEAALEALDEVGHAGEGREGGVTLERPSWRLPFSRHLSPQTPTARQRPAPPLSLLSPMPCHASQLREATEREPREEARGVFEELHLGGALL